MNAYSRHFRLHNDGTVAEAVIERLGADKLGELIAVDLKLTGTPGVYVLRATHADGDGLWRHAYYAVDNVAFDAVTADDLQDSTVDAWKTAGGAL